MYRPPELFALGAVLFFGAGLISRLLASATQFAVSIHGRATAYAFSIEHVCFFMAAFFAVFAALYSFWLIPLSHRAAVWHFWLSAIGALLFWISLYAFSYTAGLRGSFASGVLVALLVSCSLLLAGQAVFLTNLLATLLRGHRT